MSSSITTPTPSSRSFFIPKSCFVFVIGPPSVRGLWIRLVGQTPRIATPFSPVQVQRAGSPHRRGYSCEGPPSESQQEAPPGLGAQRWLLS